MGSDQSAEQPLHVLVRQAPLRVVRRFPFSHGVQAGLQLLGLIAAVADRGLIARPLTHFA